MNSFTCESKDHKPIKYDLNLLNLTSIQKDMIKNHISKYNANELKDAPLKIKLSSDQQNELLHAHKEFIEFLREQFPGKNDVEIGLELEKEGELIFSKHALERLSQRFLDGTPDNFRRALKLFEFGELLNAAKENAIQLLFNPTSIESRVEFRTPPLCRINYRIVNDKTVLVVQENIFDVNLEYFKIITVIKKAA